MTKRKTVLSFITVVLLTHGSESIFSQTRREPRLRQEVAARSRAVPAGLLTREIKFYSEGVVCYGKLFLPLGTDSQSKLPAVVLAPDWGKTSSSLEQFAAQFALYGLAALAIDYRGWGKSGGFVQTAEPVKTDDRLRFSQMTAKVKIRRRVLSPQKQILDIRNALYFLQGEPGIERSRIGVWGAGMAGGHAIVIAANDPRVKAVVVQRPIIEGKNTPKTASVPSTVVLNAAQKRARIGDGNASVTGLRDFETELALVEYHPFWDVEMIPKTTAVLFVIVDKDPEVKNESNAIAASKLVKGTTEVLRIPGTQIVGAAYTSATRAAADWFLKNL